MKRYLILLLSAALFLSCDGNVDWPFGPDDDLPLPSGTEGSTYEFTTIEYDGLLATDNDDDVADKSDSDIYWEAEAEADGTFKNTISIVYDGSDATVTMTKNAEKVFKAEKQGAHVVILPSGDDVKKCEIILSGASDDGSLKIYCTTNPEDKEAGKKVKLTLNGLKLKSQRGPAINYQAGKRMFLHLADGTENTLEDAASYSDDIFYFTGRTATGEDRKGCFFSEKAVVVSGRGKLTVTGNNKHAISVDNDFYMRPGPTVVVTGAAKNCLHCNDEIHFAGGYFYANNSSAGGKGIKTDSTLVVDAGRLVINTSGVYAYEDNDTVSPKGMKIDNDITINGGDITVRCVGKGEGSEGIESKKTITVNGGKIDVMAYDDAVNAAEVVTVTGGEIFSLSVHNDGIDSNGDIVIKGGVITSIASNMEAALDNDNPGQRNTFKVDGGEVIGIGGAVYSPDSDSGQYSIVYNGCPLSTMEEMTVKDASGKTILAITSPQGSQRAGVIFSSAKFENKGTYTISIGNTVYQTVTLSGKVTTIGTQMGPGGGGGFGPGGPGKW
jgi:hypothetical protein